MKETSSPSSVEKFESKCAKALLEHQASLEPWKLTPEIIAIKIPQEPHAFVKPCQAVYPALLKKAVPRNAWLIFQLEYLRYVALTTSPDLRDELPFCPNNPTAGPCLRIELLPTVAGVDRCMRPLAIRACLDKVKFCPSVDSRSKSVVAHLGGPYQVDTFTSGQHIVKDARIVPFVFGQFGFFEVDHMFVDLRSRSREEITR